jgi:hypothetical protein
MAMHWILQDNLFNEANYSNLVEALERLRIPYDVVKVVPFSHGLPWEQRITPLVNPQGRVMVSGSISLATLAADRGWTPGSFHNANHDYQVWKQHMQGHLLNDEAIVAPLSEIPHVWDVFFIRPTEDTKSFSGQKMDWVQFEAWRNQVLNLKEYYTTIDANTMVMMAPLKKIYREARFFVVDGQVITGSTYKLGSRVLATQEVPPTMWEYAERMVKIWGPARAYVMDLALTDDADDGYNKIVEYNCCNCAGFYEIDIQKWVMAIQQMEFDV